MPPAGPDPKVLSTMDPEHLSPYRPDGKLYGFICVVTGATQPLGRAITMELAGRKSLCPQSARLTLLSSPRRCMRIRMLDDASRPGRRPACRGQLCAPQHQDHPVPAEPGDGRGHADAHRRHTQRLGQARRVGFVERATGPTDTGDDSAQRLAQVLRGQRHGALFRTQVCAACHG
ncbi:hypothetical protein BKA81DRAFT_167353 [Phyllosticta paracitricarpa]